MILPGTKLKVADNSGAKIVECIDIIGTSSNRRGAEIGQFIICSVKEARSGGTVDKKEVVKGVIARQRKPYRRKNGTIIRFDDNALILVDDDLKQLIGNRINGPIPYEIREKMPAVASYAKEIV